MIAYLFRLFPRLEVVVRLAFWRFPIVQGVVRRLFRRPALCLGPGRGSRDGIQFDRVLQSLRMAGVEHGDILIVHSSYKALQGTGLSAMEIVAALQGLISDSGTLAMPAIPIIAGEPQGMDKFDDAAYRRVFTYNVQSTRIWTGALPKELMSVPGATRSRHPCNSMVAIGPHAAAMMANNLNEPEPTPCGPGSSWAFCYLHNAAIVSLGVDLAHSLTMIHVAEDLFERDWPVNDWYRRRRYRIKDGDFDQEFVIRERRHRW